MLLLLMVMMMHWRKWGTFIIIIIMIISGWCYFWWSIKGLTTQQSGVNKIVTMEQYQTGCDLSWLVICDLGRLVIDIIFTSHPSYYCLWNCWTIDNLQNGKNCKFFAAYFVTICSIYWQIANYDLMYWQFLSPLTDNFYGPKSDHSLPMSVPSKRHVCFINYSGQLYIRTSNESECM